MAHLFFAHNLNSPIPVTLSSPIPNVSANVQSTFTGRTNGYCLKTCTPRKGLSFPPLNVGLTVFAFSLSFFVLQIVNGREVT
jgi:hypothetical protein